MHASSVFHGLACLTTPQWSVFCFLLAGLSFVAGERCLTGSQSEGNASVEKARVGPLGPRGVAPCQLLCGTPIFKLLGTRPEWSVSGELQHAVLLGQYRVGATWATEYGILGIEYEVQTYVVLTISYGIRRKTVQQIAPEQAATIEQYGGGRGDQTVKRHTHTASRTAALPGMVRRMRTEYSIYRPGGLFTGP